MLRDSSCLIMIMCLVAAAGSCFAGEDASTVELKTDDDSLIRVKRQCIMVDFAEGELLVSEVLTAVNDGARTVVPKNAGRGSFRVSLPAGAGNVRTGGDMDPKLAQITDREVVYTGGFGPGSLQFVLQYSIPCTRPGLAITWPVTYDTEQVDLISPNDIAGTGVSSTDFDGQRVAQMGARPYRHMIARSKQAGSSFSVSFTVPVAPGNAFRWPGLIVAAAVSAAIVIIRGRKGPGIPNGTGV